MGNEERQVVKKEGWWDEKQVLVMVLLLAVVVAVVVVFRVGRWAEGEVVFGLSSVEERVFGREGTKKWARGPQVNSEKRRGRRRKWKT